MAQIRAVDVLAAWEAGDDEGARRLLREARSAAETSRAGAAPELPADAGAPEGPDPADPLLAELVACSAGVEDASGAVRRGDVPGLVRSARAARAALPADVPWMGLRVGAVLQAAFRFSGDPALEAEALEACRAVADRLDAPAAAVVARGLMGSIHLLAGAYPAAKVHCEAAVELAESAGLAGAPSVALAHQFRGYVLLEWNELDDARAALERAWALAGEPGRGVRSGVARVLARLNALQGEGRQARLWLERLEGVMEGPLTLRNHEWLTAVQARHAVGSGQVRALEAWLEAWGYRPDDVAAWPRAERLARLHELEQAATVLEATGRWDGLELLGAAVAEAAAGVRRWFEARGLAARAVALEARGRSAEADDAWEAALDAGVRGRFVRVYLDGDAALRAALLERAAADGSGHPEAVRVRGSAAASREGPLLTPRQADVLRRVARGASNKQAARELGLSVSTVKTHLRAAFERLGASSRTGAVAKARERGIL